MGLEKAIAHEKEHRKPFRKSKSVDSMCRNHGYCPYCLSNRMNNSNRKMQSAKSKIDEFLKEWSGCFD